MTITTEARRSIRTFSVVASVIGALVVGTAVGPFVALWSSGDLRTWTHPPDDGDEDTPVENFAGSIVGRDGSVIGVGPTRITVPEEYEGFALQFTLDHADVAEPDFTLMTVDSTAEFSYPAYVGYIGVDDPLLFTAYPGYDILIDAVGGWSGQLSVVALPELPAEAFGTRDAQYIYRGSATSGVLTVEGEGYLFARAYTLDGVEFIDGDTFAVDLGEGLRTSEFTWTASPYVLVDIVAIDDVEWTLTLHEDDEEETP